MITPGKWHYTFDEGDNFYVMTVATIESPSRFIATVPCGDNDENEDDARLIADAPELLEALRQCIDALGWVYYRESKFSEACDKGKAAIAKAEGKPE